MAHYRLIGYENRRLAARDFNDDTKDAGEIGAGHRVTALYEVVPAGVALSPPGIDSLRYQDSSAPSDDIGGQEGELLNLKLRYKAPDGFTSKKLETPVRDSGARLEKASKDMQFAAAVATFGMILRESPHRSDANFDMVYRLAEAGLGSDEHGYRAEFVELVERAEEIQRY